MRRKQLRAFGERVLLKDRQCLLPLWLVCAQNLLTRLSQLVKPVRVPQRDDGRRCLSHGNGTRVTASFSDRHTTRASTALMLTSTDMWRPSVLLHLPLTPGGTHRRDGSSAELRSEGGHRILASIPAARASTKVSRHEKHATGRGPPFAKGQDGDCEQNSSCTRFYPGSRGGQSVYQSRPSNTLMASLDNLTRHRQHRTVNLSHTLVNAAAHLRFSNSSQQQLVWSSARVHQPCQTSTCRQRPSWIRCS